MLYEALGAGVPVVAFPDSGNVSDVVRKEGVGLLVDYDMSIVANSITSARFRRGIERARNRVAAISGIAKSGTSASLWTRMAK